MGNGGEMLQVRSDPLEHSHLLHGLCNMATKEIGIIKCVLNVFDFVPVACNCVKRVLGNPIRDEREG